MSKTQPLARAPPFFDMWFRLVQVKTLPPYPDMEVVVPEGHGWLEGDAPFNSEDSNHFGPVS